MINLFSRNFPLLVQLIKWVKVHKFSAFFFPCFLLYQFFNLIINKSVTIAQIYVFYNPIYQLSYSNVSNNILLKSFVKLTCVSINLKIFLRSHPKPKLYGELNLIKYFYEHFFKLKVSLHNVIKNVLINYLKSNFYCYKLI